MAKKPALKPKPRAATPDAFVAAVGGGKEPVARLTIDLPPELHRQFKSMAATEGERMVSLVRRWIEDYCTKRPGLPL